MEFAKDGGYRQVKEVYKEEYYKDEDGGIQLEVLMSQQFHKFDNQNVNQLSLKKNLLQVHPQMKDYEIKKHILKQNKTIKK